MWDEKQFFDDFVKESEQKQPSSEFIDKMKNLSKEPQQAGKAKKPATPKVVIGVLSAAAVVGILFLAGGQKDNQEMLFPKDNIYADKEEDSGIIQGDLTEVLDENLLLLKKVLADTQVLIKEEAGMELAMDEREELLQQLDGAKAVKVSMQELGEKEKETYYVEGEEQICFSIVEGEYLVIQDKQVVYLLK